VLNLTADDRRTRLIAFVVITLAFIISVAALLYWAINVAAAHVSSRIMAHFDVLSPLATVSGKEAKLASEAFVTVWHLF
jgi:hypothetical protein